MSRSLYIGVIGVILGMITAPLDGMMLGPALPVIVGDLGGAQDFSWVMTAYLVPMAAATPIWGKLGDLFGRKPAYLSAIAVFLAGSALAGTSQEMWQLIAFRVLQGLGGGGLMVGALALIAELVPPRQSARLMGLFGVIMPAALIAGPLLGGVFTEQLTWRWAFYINLPIGAVAVLLVATRIHLEPRRIAARIDAAGALLLTAVLVALSLLSSWAGTRYSWISAPVLGLAGTAVVALVIFLRVERRAAEPIVPLRLFADRSFTLAQILRLTAGAAMMVFAAFLPLYMQLAKGASPTASGLLILPAMLGMVAASVGSGQLISRTGRYRGLAVLGGATLTAGMLALLTLEPDTNLALASALTLLGGAGVGLIMQSTTIITINSAPPRDMGAASGSVTLWHTMGASLGAAVLGALYTSRLTDTLVDRLGVEQAGLTLSGGELTAGAVRRLPRVAQDAIRVGVADGVHGMAAAGAALGVVALVLAWLIRETALRDRATPKPTDAESTTLEERHV
ncbi:MDR family MFS transporter [Dactylosporangium sp. NPDC005572]|uniref:MDR family MFS transporter n=1 Tax=Dactylosporangium sp. NPDC005572 TaxID=3156889 RepID=UPI0033A2F452